MISYPVFVARKSYRGSDPKRRAKVANINRIAARIEDYLNQDLSAKPDDSIHVYSSYSIAHDIREDSEIVHDVIFATDCGSNGITIVKGDYERAMRGGRLPSQPATEKSEI